jgi:uracil phosphoribosyltransferase
MADQVYVSRHPLVLHKLTLLRSKITEPKKFRELVRELSLLLFYEATYDLALAPLTVETPMGDAPGHEIVEDIGLVPILRAGLGMVDPILSIMPVSHIWHIGIYRDHETLQPITYYNKTPQRTDVDLALVLDPMLATGGSAIAAIDILKDQWHVRRVKFLGLIAAPEGTRALQNVHPDVSIHVAAMDNHLNDEGYIIPGLGDSGDRQFGTG